MSIHIKAKPREFVVYDRDGITSKATEEKMPKKKTEKIPETNSSSWAKLTGNYFTGIDETLTKLESGIYEPVSINNGTPALHKKPSQPLTQDLIKFDDTADKIITEVNKFLDAKDKFERVGIRYRRGILMYGPPGGGKSCIIKELINLILERDGIAIDGSNAHPGVTSTILGVLKSVEQDRLAIVFLEDIDALIREHNKSMVLNMIDGVTSPNGLIYVATTNFPEELEDNIQNRPSRFDRSYHIEFPTDEGRKRLIEGFSKKYDCSVDVDRWVKDTNKMTVSHINELFISTQLLGHEYDEAIEHLRSLAKKKKSAHHSASAVGFSR